MAFFFFDRLPMCVCVQRNIMPIEWDSMNSLSIHFILCNFDIIMAIVRLLLFSFRSTVSCSPFTYINAATTTAKCKVYSAYRLYNWLNRPLQIKKQKIENCTNRRQESRKKMVKSRWTIWPGTQSIAHVMIGIHFTL